jgi:hypothetical protein
VSYLPDLTAYLDDLLRTRERLAAASGADGWARAAAAPSAQEITKIRQLISRIKAGIEDLPPGAPPDIHALNDKISQLEQQAAGLRIQLAERDDELTAARAANRELMTRINHAPKIQ